MKKIKFHSLLFVLIGIEDTDEEMNEKDSHPIFKEFPNDELLGHSQEDQEFLAIMGEHMKVNHEGHLQAPLPFKAGLEGPKLPNNSRAVYNRTLNTLKKLKKSNPELLDFCVTQMGKHIANKHVEVVKEDEPSTETTTSTMMTTTIAYSKNLYNRVRLHTLGIVMHRRL